MRTRRRSISELRGCGVAGLRRLIPIVKATALEILSEPLSLLVLLAALVLTVLAPAFHYHQFGEATRMARDACLSSVLMGGLVIAVFGTIRAFRREVESGTMAMALAHPVSRTGFFLAKTLGAGAAYLVFASIVFLTALVIVDGAAIGGLIAAKSGDIARIYGPNLAEGVGVIVLPLLVGAALNRFGNVRFVLSSFVLALALSVVFAALSVVRDATVFLRLLPVMALIALFTFVLLVASAAFAVRFKANAAASSAGLVLALLLPAVGNYYLADALSKGGSVPWTYVGCAALATLPAVLLFLFLGIHFINGRDIS